MSNSPDTTALTGATHSTIYVAVEISLKSWIVGVHCPDASGGSVSIHTLAAADTAGLLDLVGSVRKRVAREVGARPRVMLTYEAGYEGFWLARDIERRDAEIDIFMNDPASLRVNRRAKKKKTDRIDARRMVRALKAWDQGDSEAMSWVRVPDVDREDARRLLRERDTLVKERTRLNNRIKGLLQLHASSIWRRASRTFSNASRPHGRAMERRCRRGRGPRSRGRSRCFAWWRATSI